MAPLENWNRAQDNLGLSKLLIQKEKKELFNKYYVEFNLSKDDDNLDKLKTSLTEMIERRLRWKYNRLHRMFFDKVNCQVVKYRKKVNLKDPKQFEWLGLTEELENSSRSEANRKKKDAGFIIVDEPVVQVDIEGFMVFTPKRTTNDRASATMFKNTIMKLDGVIDKPFKYTITTDVNTVNPIQLPMITDPHPREGAAPAGGGFAEAGGQVTGPAVQAGQELQFELVQESIGRVTYHFFYVPKP